MAEEIYFIKTNPTIAKINLYKKLCSEEDIVLNYLDDDKKTSLEVIKAKVSDSVENLTPDELRSIFHWFHTEYNDKTSDPEECKEEIINQLFINGIDQFYEIPSTDAPNFNQIITDYQKYSHSNLNYKFNAENFSPFLIYGIFFTGLINRFHKKENSQILLMDFLKPDFKTLYSFAEEEFNSGVKNQEKESLYGFDSVLSTYFGELYDLTRYYKDPIIKLDEH
ncbi:hypothetical protein CEY12_10080 [Chryseobacterium sp. T16E-39]|uniref:hypothetical protein n=1 Tax=Chryseobacterium sp. T16E-39 TaxID=2015076 RepID=UPI000B5B20D4|nr:hypothetical protein [Chryseobacterium sp. T16E-39]ASK30434.1 hypothetical protein CEY12_10080 [Chryseobacterium sp. T16E-39]